ncbi:hypothetical protein, partial [Vibrio celticus]|uniref:hypothetical protein n=1 Tax=Vibrio celticus TaxID=446372 RepID=UPI00406785A9
LKLVVLTKKQAKRVALSLNLITQQSLEKPQLVSKPSPLTRLNSKAPFSGNLFVIWVARVPHTIRY